MCGIAAIFARSTAAPAVDAGELRRIRDHMASRGPDAAGEWFSPDQRVGLGHRRLSIIDLSDNGAQPMLNREHNLAIVFNGEIYNYRELRARLEKSGRVFQSQSDTEVLLHLYAEKGAAMLDDLRGMYAFAIWDANKRGLFLARDPFGIKPLYYADDGRTFRAASQVKALRAGGAIDGAPEPAAHVGFFLWGHVPEPYTLHRAIRALPAGHSLWVDETGPGLPKSFCNLTEILAHAQDNVPEISPGAAAEQLRAALEDSVRHHLIADVPVGVFLSSGLDSTTLVALAAQERGRLKTVTLAFEEYRGTEDDESPLAETVARQYGTEHQTVWISRADFTAQLEHLFASMDQPTIDGPNTYFVSLAAVRASLKVALSGVGGDELFGGYPCFREIPQLVRALRFFPGRAIGRPMRMLSHGVLKQFTSPKYAGLFEYGGSYAGAYMLRRGMFMPWELPRLLDADLLRAGWQELQPLLRLENVFAGLRTERLKITALEMSCYMRNQLLRDADWASMAHSLELRTPLVDVALLRSLAPLLAGKTPPGKRDMADAPTQKLPDAVLHRRKTGFTVPVRAWLAQDSGTLERGTAPRSGERGLRSWSRAVYARFQQN